MDTWNGFYRIPEVQFLLEIPMINSADDLHSNMLNNFKEAYLKAKTLSEKDVLWSKVLTPFIEKIVDDQNNSLVTFLYRKIPSESSLNFSVYLDSSVIGMPLSDNSQLISISGTDLFYLTLKLPNNLRTTYTFLKFDKIHTNLSMPEMPHMFFPFPEFSGEMKKTYSIITQLHQEKKVELDHRNPKKISYLDYENPDYCFFTESILELPQAPSQKPYLSDIALIREKRIQLIEQKRFFEHTILFSETSLKHLPEYMANPEEQDQPPNDRRKYWIYLPPGYKDNSEIAYPLYLFLDGSDYLNTIPVPSILDKMIISKEISPCIAVFFEYSPVRRQLEYYGDKNFTRFLAEDLLMTIRNKYHLPITRHPQQTTIVGLSASGLAAIYAGLTYPNVFGNIITQSAALWSKKQSDLTKMVDEHVLKGTNSHFYMEAGIYENVPIECRFEDGSTQAVSILESNKAFATYMSSKGINAKFHEFTGGHNYVCYKNTLSDRLREVFNDN